MTSVVATRYVIGPDVALRLARDRAVVPAEHQLVASPTPLGQVVTRLTVALARIGVASLATRPARPAS